MSTFCNIFIIKMLKSKTYEELRLCSVNNELITLSITIFQLLNPLLNFRDQYSNGAPNLVHKTK